MRLVVPWRVARGACTVVAAAGCSNALPPYPEALVVVDTDLPAPAIAGRLRVDFFGPDGTWFDSRDIARPDPSDWPTSFSVWSNDTRHDKLVMLRLRVYADGLDRPYTGERFTDHGVAPADGPGPDDQDPRLLDASGDDITPATEPLPGVAVDRLVLLHFRPGVRGRVRVLLQGACAGTMPMLSQTAPYQQPVLSAAQTCVDTEGARVPLVEAPFESDMTVPATSAQGTFATSPCDPGAPPDPRAVCVPGGAFVMGSPSDASGGVMSAAPQRVVALAPFWLDREEVTVGQIRAAAAHGLALASADIYYLDAPLGSPVTTPGAADSWCTYSTTPMGRESYAVACVSHELARRYCQLEGGDLPTEAQWEYAATAAGRTFKTSYPWGDDPPTCDRAVYARAPPQLLAAVDGTAADCASLGALPQPVAAAPGDATPLGIHGMGGGQSEYVLDWFGAYSDPCWAGASLWNPSCDVPSGYFSTRGAGWADDPLTTRGSWRPLVAASGHAAVGFRCAFVGAPGHP